MHTPKRPHDSLECDCLECLRFDSMLAVERRFAPMFDVANLRMSKDGTLTGDLTIRDPEPRTILDVKIEYTEC
jgi:hypothetical protein